MRRGQNTRGMRGSRPPKMDGRLEPRANRVRNGVEDGCTGGTRAGTLATAAPARAPLSPQATLGPGRQTQQPEEQGAWPRRQDKPHRHHRQGSPAQPQRAHSAAQPPRVRHECANSAALPAAGTAQGTGLLQSLSRQTELRDVCGNSRVVNTMLHYCEFNVISHPRHHYSARPCTVKRRYASPHEATLRACR
jgi:hypothetical protein